MHPHPGCPSGAASYKQLKLTSTWTNATGQSRSLVLDTTVSPTTVGTGDNTLDNTTFSVVTGSSPVVREANPGNTLGVIPIAVSSSSNAAATNPQPIVTNTGTTFSTLTYVAAASSLGGNQITQRIDTKVLQCSCSFSGTSGVAVSPDSNLTTTMLKQPYGPTYWDGTQYVSPAQTPGATSSTTGVTTAATQDPDCDVCCRDRSDGVGNKDTLGNTISFDNFTGNTSKYEYVSGVISTVSSGNFVQACRMIRVGGSYVAATDAHLNFFNGSTDNCAAEISAGYTAAPTGCTSSLASSDTVPAGPLVTPPTETNYANAVVDYACTTTSPVLTTTGKPTIVNTDPAGIERRVKYVCWRRRWLCEYAAHLCVSAPEVTISLPNTISRWVYARGVYIDYLQAKAQTALASAITNCATDRSRRSLTARLRCCRSLRST